MKYAAYGEYKTSPMTWLDQLPTHWNAASLRWMSKRYAGGTPDKGNEAYWEDGEIPWINSGAVNDGYITRPSELITREGFANSSAKWIPKDALVMALAGQGKTKGMVAQLGIPTTCNQSMAALIPDHRFTPRYLYYWLTANYQNIRNLAGGEARDGLNLEMLGSIPCPVPPIDEQQTIAHFLDAKTAQIDALVAQKRQLIAKLKEKRSALISRTVTRGLPPKAAKAAGLEPNPKMKDSGVDWLDVIPAHWELQSIKRCCFVIDCKHITAEFVDEGFPLASIREVQSRYVNLTDAKQTSIDYYVELIGGGRKPTSGDLIFSRNATVGEIAQVTALLPPFAMGQDVCLIRKHREEMSSDFLQIALKSTVCVSQIENLMVGSTFKRVNVEGIRNLLVPLPPIEEQVAIAAYLECETSKIDRLISLTEDATSRLIEYRQALITSAVTGKIDVRAVANREREMT